MLRFVTAVHPQMDRDGALTHNPIRDLQLLAAAGGICQSTAQPPRFGSNYTPGSSKFERLCLCFERRPWDNPCAGSRGKRGHGNGGSDG